MLPWTITADAQQLSTSWGLEKTCRRDLRPFCCLPRSRNAAMNRSPRAIVASASATVKEKD